MVNEYILKQKQESETLRISKPIPERYNAAMSRLGVPKDAPLWHDKPTNLPRASPRHQWLPSKEDSPENRTAYMAYLRNTEHLVLPHDTIIFDGTQDPKLLSVEMKGFRIKTSGNVDVPIANSRHQSLATVKENMLGALELKKDTNTAHTDIERQVTLQHMASSYLNPDTGLLTIMTDLNGRWHFFWFVKEKRLMRYESSESEARFLIEHMLDDPDCVSAPTGFLSRACWNDLFLETVLEERPSGNFPDNVNRDDDEDNHTEPSDDTSEISRSHPVESLSRSRENEANGLGKLRAKSGQDESACLSSFQFLDKEEELEAVLGMATQTVFHRMLGPPPPEQESVHPSIIEFSTEV